MFKNVSPRGETIFELAVAKFEVDDECSKGFVLEYVLDHILPTKSSRLLVGIKDEKYLNISLILFVDNKIGDKKKV